MRVFLYTPQTIHEVGARANQEDAVYPKVGAATVNDHLFVLCDGMGGHERGEVASNAVCQTLSAALSDITSNGVLTDEMFRNAVNQAFQKLDSLDPLAPSDNGMAKKPMGTTMTCVCLHRGGVFMAHIGDSRIYHIRPAEQRILYKSRDHSLVFDLFMAGELKQEEMATAPNKNVITRAMTTHQEQKAKADIAHTTDIQPGDYFYLCSDGMLEQMDDEELLQVLCSSASDEEKRQILIDRTAWNKDNHSAHLIRVRSVTKEEHDREMPNDETTAKCNALVWEHPVQQEQPITVVPYTPSASPRVTSVEAMPKTPNRPFYKRLLLIALTCIVVAGLMLLARQWMVPKPRGKADKSVTEMPQNTSEQSDYFLPNSKERKAKKDSPKEDKKSKPHNQPSAQDASATNAVEEPFRDNVTTTPGPKGSPAPSGKDSAKTHSSGASTSSTHAGGGSASVGGDGEHKGIEAGGSDREKDLIETRNL